MRENHNTGSRLNLRQSYADIVVNISGTWTSCVDGHFSKGLIANCTHSKYTGLYMFNVEANQYPLPGMEKGFGSSMLLLKALQEHNSSCLLLYGAVTDSIIEKDLQLHPFEEALHHALRAYGYDNILFFGKNGKYVLDDSSAWYSIVEARSAYEAKYGGSPMDATGGILDEAFPVESVSIPYRQSQLEPALFYSELCGWITNSTVKTACVMWLPDFVEMFPCTEIMERPWEQNTTCGTLILVDPSGPEFFLDDYKVKLLQASGLYQHFVLEDRTGYRKPHPEHCIPVLATQNDEIRYALEKLRLQYQVEFYDGVTKAGQIIGDLTRNRNALRVENILDRGASYLAKEHSHQIGDSFYEAVCDTGCIAPTSALKQLYTKVGWSEATEMLVNQLIIFYQHVQQVSCPSKSLHERVLWLAAQQSKSRNYSAQSNMWRFGNEETETYPSSATLPHLLLLGPHGTGKKSAVEEIGRILRDTGFLAYGHVYRVQAEDLLKQKQALSWTLWTCEHGVLFLDHAEILWDPSLPQSERREAMSLLTEILEDTSRHIVVVLSGCPPVAEKQGLSLTTLLEQEGQRWLVVETRDLTPAELSAIFLETLRKKEYSLAPDISVLDIENWMTYCYERRNRNFQNGVFAASIADMCMENAKKRGVQWIGQEDFGAQKSFFEPVTMERLEEPFKRYQGIGDLGICILRETVQLYHNRLKVGLRASVLPGCIVLHGSRGTGKKTLAKLLNSAWGLAGLLSENPPVVLSGDEINHLSVLQEHVYLAAEERTTLIIPEAEKISPYLTDQVLETIQQVEDVPCILTVNTAYMDSPLVSDPGVTERVGKIYTVKDYTPEIQMQMLMDILHEHGKTLNADSIDVVQRYFQTLADNRPQDDSHINAHAVLRMTEVLTAAEPSVLGIAQIPEFVWIEMAALLKAPGYLNVLQELRAFVGCRELKEYLYPLQMQRSNDICRRLLLVGEPGTGKTIAARWIAQALSSLGVTEHGHVQCYYAPQFAADSLFENALAGITASGADRAVIIDDLQFYGPEYCQKLSNEILEYYAQPDSIRRGVVILVTSDQLAGDILSHYQIISFPALSSRECEILMETILAENGITLGENIEAAELFEQARASSEKRWGNAISVKEISQCILQAHVNRIISTQSSEGPVTPEDVRTGFAAWEGR